MAKKAGVSVDVYSLARVMESEERKREARIAVGWALRNWARHKNKSITDIVTAGWTKDSNKKAIHSKSHGYYGRQNTGKYASSISEPSKATLQLAIDILDGKIADITNGAIKFDNVKAQSALAKSGATGYGKTPEQVAIDRQKEGLAMVTIPGISTRFWRVA